MVATIIHYFQEIRIKILFLIHFAGLDFVLLSHTYSPSRAGSTSSWARYDFINIIQVIQGADVLEIIQVIVEFEADSVECFTVPR